MEGCADDGEREQGEREMRQTKEASEVDEE